MGGTSLSCLEDTMLQQASWSSGSYNRFTVSAMFPRDSDLGLEL